MKSTQWKDFLSFRRMVTPVIIKMFFWINVVVNFAITGLLFATLVITLLNNVEYIYAALIAFSLPVVLAIIFLVIRVYSELFIIIFQINETLTDIRNALAANAK